MWLANLAFAASPADTGDTGIATPVAPDVDADLDGVTVGEGDCDDANPDVYPGVGEICGDQLDNECDGLVDEGCDRSAQLATIGGGGGCTGGGGIPGTQAALGLPALLLLWSKRR